MIDQSANILSNMIRVGIVDGINAEKGTVRVTFPDRDDMVVSDLALLSFEQSYPDIRDPVLCLFLPNGIQEGFCLGRFYNDQNRPPTQDADLFVKKIDEGLTIRYDKRSKTLDIDAANGITINGDLIVTGQIRGQVVQ